MVIENLLEMKQVSLIFPAQAGEQCVLQDVSLGVKPGEFVCIVGPSGCGKTSLLRILGGLLPPSAGSVSLAGKPLTAPRRDIGFVFQRANLMPWRTVEHNVTLPLEIEGVEAAKAREQAIRASRSGRTVRLREGLSQAVVRGHAATGCPRQGTHPESGVALDG